MGHKIISPIFSLLLLFLFTLFNLSLTQNIPDLCDPRDKSVLRRIKNHFGNPTSLASWDPTTDCCTAWKDIGCNEQGRVNMLSISDANDIRGPIPSFLDHLPFLWSLDFSRVPNLSGTIPSSIGNLNGLISLFISDTNVTGPIPRFLVQLHNMTRLFLTSNKLVGPIPDFVGQMKSLEYLDLYSNQLTGPIPQALSQLNGLSYLRLGSNKLSGQIPQFLGGLTSLTTIDLESNSLSGRIPFSIGHLPTLTTLSLSGNRLSGSLPKWLSRTQLGSLRLSHNKFIGDASFLFDKKNTQIIDIDISDNHFEFDFSNVDLGRNLVGFNISHNRIYGSLPKRFGQLRVEYVDVSHNQLCGPIPNGRRFKKVDPSIFAHNKCLCGGPLQPCK